MIISFLHHCWILQRKSGLKFLVITLKAYYVVTQQSIGGQRLDDLTPLGVRFARTRKGLPRVIHRLDRKKIISNPLLAPGLIRFWLTLFSLYRVLEIPGKLKLGSITDPGHLGGLTLHNWSHFAQTFWRLTLPNVRGAKDSWMYESLYDPQDSVKELRAKPFLISKSSPAVRGERGSESPLSSSPAGVIMAAAAWVKSDLYSTLKDWIKMTRNPAIQRLIEDLAPLIDLIDPKEINKEINDLGRLGFKKEAAGKVRVFAMVDCFTQWLMKPLWDKILALLELIPQDGTKDQYRPLERLNKTLGVNSPRFCYDLSSATDRLPLLLQIQLLAPIIGLWAATTWGTLLVGRGYTALNKEFKLNETLYYEVGQPMGALTSWGMLALTHHAIVQWASQRSGVTTPYQWFGDYAVLGDDIVIANGAVANEYLRILEETGVSCNLSKSLVSVTGRVVEFAKRTLYKGVLVSPVPMAEIYAGIKSSQAAVDFSKKYQLKPSDFLRLFGAGYQVLGGIQREFSDMGRKWRALLLSYISPFGVIEKSWFDFITSRSLISQYTRDQDLYNESLRNFSVESWTKILDDIDQLSPVLQHVKRLVEVRRDREYYGTIKVLSKERAIFWKGLKSSLDWDIQRRLEDLKNALYREVFLDVLCDVRDLRNLCDEQLHRDSFDEQSLQSIGELVSKVQDDLSGLPLPKDLFVRKEVTARALKDDFTILLWHRYSKPYRVRERQHQDKRTI